MADNTFTTSFDFDTRRAERQISNLYNSANRQFSQGIEFNFNIQKRPLGDVSRQLTEFDKSLEASNARVLAFGASTGVIVGLSRAMRALVSDTAEVNKALVDIQSILNATTSSLKEFSSGLFDISRRSSLPFATVAQAAQEFSRQGLNLTETLQATEAALILFRTSGLDAVASVEALTAAVNTFNSEGLNYIDVVDRMVSLDTAFAVSTKDLAEGLRRVGATAADANVSFNELAAGITAIQQLTARGGAVISNGLKTIFTRLQRQSVREALEGIGVATEEANGSFRNAFSVLTDLANKFDGLNDSLRANIAETVAGGFQINTLRATLRALGGEYSVFQQALDKVNNSQGEAFLRQEALNKSLSAQIQQLRNSFTELNSIAGEILLTPIVELGTDVFGNLATLLKDFFEKSSDEVSTSISDIVAKGLVEGLKQALSGPALAAGLIIISRTFARVFDDIRTAVATLAEFNKSNREREVLERKIIFALEQGDQQLVSQLQTATSITEKQKLLNQLIDQELIKDRQRLSTLETYVNLLDSANAKELTSERTANNRFRFGLFAPNPISPRNIRNAAVGYVPALAKERESIRKNVGGARATAMPVIKNIITDRGREPVVVNTDEYIVRNYMGSKKDAVLNRDMVSSLGGAKFLSALGRVESLASGKLPIRGNTFALNRKPITKVDLYNFLKKSRGNFISFDYKTEDGTVKKFNNAQWGVKRDLLKGAPAPGGRSSWKEFDLDTNTIVLWSQGDGGQQFRRFRLDRIENFRMNGQAYQVTAPIGGGPPNIYEIASSPQKSSPEQMTLEKYFFGSLADGYIPNLARRKTLFDLTKFTRPRNSDEALELLAGALTGTEYRTRTARGPDLYGIGDVKFKRNADQIRSNFSPSSQIGKRIINNVFDAAGSFFSPGKNVISDPSSIQGLLDSKGALSSLALFTDSASFGGALTSKFKELSFLSPVRSLFASLKTKKGAPKSLEKYVRGDTLETIKNLGYPDLEIPLVNIPVKRDELSDVTSGKLGFDKLIARVKGRISRYRDLYINPGSLKGFAQTGISKKAAFEKIEENIAKMVATTSEVTRKRVFNETLDIAQLFREDTDFRDRFLGALSSSGLVDITASSSQERLNKSISGSRIFATGYTPKFGSNFTFNPRAVFGQGSFKKVFNVKGLQEIQGELFGKPFEDLLYGMKPEDVVLSILRRKNNDFDKLEALGKQGDFVPKILARGKISFEGYKREAALMEKLVPLSSNDVVGKVVNSSLLAYPNLDRAVADQLINFLNPYLTGYRKTFNGVKGDLATRNLGITQGGNFDLVTTILAELADGYGSQYSVGDAFQAGLRVLDAGFLRPKGLANGFVPNLAVSKLYQELLNKARKSGDFEDYSNILETLADRRDTKFNEIFNPGRVIGTGAYKTGFEGSDNTVDVVTRMQEQYSDISKLLYFADKSPLFPKVYEAGLVNSNRILLNHPDLAYDKMPPHMESRGFGSNQQLAAANVERIPLQLSRIVRGMDESDQYDFLYANLENSLLGYLGKNGIIRDNGYGDLHNDNLGLTSLNTFDNLNRLKAFSRARGTDARYAALEDLINYSGLRILDVGGLAPRADGYVPNLAYPKVKLGRPLGMGGYKQAFDIDRILEGSLPFAARDTVALRTIKKNKDFSVLKRLNELGAPVVDYYGRGLGYDTFRGKQKVSRVNFVEKVSPLSDNIFGQPQIPQAIIDRLSGSPSALDEAVRQYTRSFFGLKREDLSKSLVSAIAPYLKSVKVTGGGSMENRFGDLIPNNIGISRYASDPDYILALLREAADKSLRQSSRTGAAQEAFKQGLKILDPGYLVPRAAGYVPNLAKRSYADANHYRNQYIQISKSEVDKAVKANDRGRLSGYLYERLTASRGEATAYEDAKKFLERLSPGEREAYFSASSRADSQNPYWSQFNVRKTGARPSNPKILNYKSYFTTSVEGTKRILEGSDELKAKLKIIADKYNTDLSFKSPSTISGAFSHNDSLVVHYTNPKAAQEIEQTIRDFGLDRDTAFGSRAYTRGYDYFDQKTGALSYGQVLSDQMAYDLLTGKSIQETTAARLKDAFALGHIPNLAKPLADSMAREVVALRQLGYGKNEAIKSLRIGSSGALANRLNPQGLGVYNMLQGQTSLGKALNDHRATGYVPNLATPVDNILGSAAANLARESIAIGREMERWADLLDRGVVSLDHYNSKIDELNVRQEKVDKSSQYLTKAAQRELEVFPENAIAKIEALSLEADLAAKALEDVAGLKKAGLNKKDAFTISDRAAIEAVSSSQLTRGVFEGKFDADVVADVLGTRLEEIITAQNLRSNVLPTADFDSFLEGVKEFPEFFQNPGPALQDAINKSRSSSPTQAAQGRALITKELERLRAESQRASAAAGTTVGGAPITPVSQGQASQAQVLPTAQSIDFESLNDSIRNLEGRTLRGKAFQRIRSSEFFQRIQDLPVVGSIAKASTSFNPTKGEIKKAFIDSGIAQQNKGRLSFNSAEARDLYRQTTTRAKDIRSQRNSQLGIGLSIAAPFLAQTLQASPAVQRVFGINNTPAGQARKGVFDGAVSGIATGAAVGGSIGGPLGAAIGVTIGLFTTLNAALESANQNLEALSNQLVETKTRNAENLQNIQGVGSALVKFNELLEAGAKPELIAQARKDLTNAIQDVGDPSTRKELFEAVNKNDLEQIQKISFKEQGRSRQEESVQEANLALAKVLEENRGFLSNLTGQAEITQISVLEDIAQTLIKGFDFEAASGTEEGRAALAKIDEFVRAGGSAENAFTRLSKNDLQALLPGITQSQVVDGKVVDNKPVFDAFYNDLQDTGVGLERFLSVLGQGISGALPQNLDGLAEVTSAAINSTKLFSQYIDLFSRQFNASVLQSDFARATQAEENKSAVQLGSFSTKETGVLEAQNKSLITEIKNNAAASLQQIRLGILDQFSGLAETSKDKEGQSVLRDLSQKVSSGNLTIEAALIEAKNKLSVVQTSGANELLNSLDVLGQDAAKQYDGTIAEMNKQLKIQEIQYAATKQSIKIQEDIRDISRLSSTSMQDLVTKIGLVSRGNFDVSGQITERTRNLQEKRLRERFGSGSVEVNQFRRFREDEKFNRAQERIRALQEIGDTPRTPQRIESLRKQAARDAEILQTGEGRFSLQAVFEEFKSVLKESFDLGGQDRQKEFFERFNSRDLGIGKIIEDIGSSPTELISGIDQVVSRLDQAVKSSRVSGPGLDIINEFKEQINDIKAGLDPEAIKLAAENFAKNLIKSESLDKRIADASEETNSILGEMKGAFGISLNTEVFGQMVNQTADLSKTMGELKAAITSLSGERIAAETTVKEVNANKQRGADFFLSRGIDKFGPNTDQRSLDLVRDELTRGLSKDAFKSVGFANFDTLIRAIEKGIVDGLDPQELRKVSEDAINSFKVLRVNEKSNEFIDPSSESQNPINKDRIFASIDDFLKRNAGSLPQRGADVRSAPNAIPEFEKVSSDLQKAITELSKATSEEKKLAEAIQKAGQDTANTVQGIKEAGIEAAEALKSSINAISGVKIDATVKEVIDGELTIDFSLASGATAEGGAALSTTSLPIGTGQTMSKVFQDPAFRKEFNDRVSHLIRKHLNELNKDRPPGFNPSTSG